MSASHHFLVSLPILPITCIKTRRPISSKREDPSDDGWTLAVGVFSSLVWILVPQLFAHCTDLVPFASLSSYKLKPHLHHDSPCSVPHAYHRIRLCRSARVKTTNWFWQAVNLETQMVFDWYGRTGPPLSRGPSRRGRIGIPEEHEKARGPQCPHRR
jgi:hypothetical protein